MDTRQFLQHDETTWEIQKHGAMRVPAIIYADSRLILEMDQKVYQQLSNVATLPGIVKAAYAMPDAHWGYGFPIGGVAEEAPLAYKNVNTVVNAADQAGLARKVARLEPIICIKG